MNFRINHEKVIQQADSILEDSDLLYEQIQRLYQLEQECRSHWKGEASEAFLSRMMQLRDEMTRTRMQMQSLASTIRFCADRIQREDEDAAERARMLNAGFLTGL